MELDSSPFYVSPDTQVSLFRGVSTSRRELPVVVRQHQFDLQRAEDQIGISQSLSATLVQVKEQGVHADILEILVYIENMQCWIGYVMEDMQSEVKNEVAKRKGTGQLFTEQELQRYLQLDLQSASHRDIAEDYNLETEPFSFNPETHVGLYKGVRDQTLVIVKEHEFSQYSKAEVWNKIADSLNAGLTQAKLQHLHTCEIYELRLQLEGRHCRVYHVLEALESDIKKDIEERRRNGQLYTEAELHDFMTQIVEVLAYAHDKGIAHRDLHPSNIFRSQNTYKIGDFGSFFLRRDGSYTKTAGGHMHFMSPQLRQACTEQIPYNAFKADVFSLGATLHAMVTLEISEAVQPFESMNSDLERALGPLPYPQQLKNLINAMMATREDMRPTMREIHSLLSIQSLYAPAHDPLVPQEAPHEQPVQEVQEVQQVTPRCLFLFLSDTIEVSADTFRKVQEDLEPFFSLTQVVCPILVLSARRENSLMKLLIEQSQSEPRGQIDRNWLISAPEGVYMWPFPLRFGQTAVLLVLMQITPKRQACEEARRKIRALLMAISSVCCVSEQNGLEMQEAKSCLSDYSEIRKHLGFRMAQFGVYLGVQDEAIYDTLRSGYADVFELIRADDTAGWLYDLSEWSFHASYRRTHKTFFQKNVMYQYLYFIYWSIHSANKYLNASAFIASNELKQIKDMYASFTERKALPLITIEPSNGLKPQCSVSLNEDTLMQLMASFNLASYLFPVLIFGSERQSGLLEAIITYVVQDPEEVVSFLCAEDDSYGVFVWPRPIILGHSIVMLMKLHTPSNASVADKAAIRRVLAGLMFLSSVFCLCEKSNTILGEIGGFLQDYELLQRQTHQSISKLLVFAQESWLNRQINTQSLEELQKKYGDLLGMVYHSKERNSKSWVKFVVDCLSKDDLHAPYIQTHQRLFGSNYINSFLSLLRDTFLLANFSLEFSVYLSNLPDPGKPAAIDLGNIELSALRAEIFAIDGEALTLLNEVEGKWLPDPQTMKLLKQMYSEDPLVILAVMGKESIGKSSLCNSIIQRCFKLPELPIIFPIGNRTQGCLVLSHPIYHEGKQVMLVDMEGQNYPRSGDVTAIERGTELLSTVLALASVPCIYVTNEETDLQLAEILVGYIDKLHIKWGFRTERIVLLLRSMNMERKASQAILDFANGLNRSYFQGNEVVQVIYDHPTELVLETLMSGNLYSKKSISGGEVMLEEVLTLLPLFSLPHYIGPLVTSERSACAPLLERKLGQLKDTAEVFQSPDDANLRVYFSEFLRLKFLPQTVAELAQMQENDRAYCLQEINLEINRQQIALREVEGCYRFILTLQGQENISRIKEFRSQLSTVWTIFGYVDSDALKKWRLAKRHFPNASDTIERRPADIKPYLVFRGWRPGVHLERDKVLTERADEIVRMRNLNFFWKLKLSGDLNPKVVKILKDGGDLQAPVLLLIGSNSTNAAAFANCFVQQIAPMTPSDFKPFATYAYSQFFSFEYSPSGADSTVGYLIYLKMIADWEYTPFLLKMAELLIPSASIACFLTKQPESYAVPLLAACGSKLFNTKIILIHAGENGYLREGLNGLAARYKLVQVTDFEHESQVRVINEVRDEFDHCQGQSTSLLQKAVESLPEKLKPLL